MKTEIIERLAALEHEQWMSWATLVIGEVGIERAERWDKFMVPYDELTDDVKEYDRKWARKVLEITK